MLKLFNSVLMLVILCGGLDSGVGEKLKCEFKDLYYDPIVGTLYSCKVTTLDNSFDNVTIDGYTGTHLANRNVKAIWIEGANTKYIPVGLGSVFNITALAVRESKIMKIESKDFQRMQNLELLALSQNKLTSVPSDAFLTLKKLKQIYLWSNQIKYIGSGAFDQLKNLNAMNWEGNICVNKDYNGATAIIQMKEDIKANCDKPNDIIQYEIEQKITNKLNELRSELHQEHNEIRNDRIEIIKLQSELSTAKDLLKTAHDQQKTDQEANMIIITERDQLKKDLSKAKETIEDFYMEVMDLKIERHNERQNSIALRFKLMEAKDQLAECKNE